MTRRRVRVDQALFDELDQQLGAERGPNCEPSAADFVEFELPTIVAEFSENFDAFSEPYANRSDYRALVARGVLVRAVLVIGQVRPDGSITLLSIDIDC